MSPFARRGCFRKKAAFHHLWMAVVSWYSCSTFSYIKNFPISILPLFLLPVCALTAGCDDRAGKDELVKERDTLQQQVQLLENELLETKRKLRAAEAGRPQLPAVSTTGSGPSSMLPLSQEEEVVEARRRIRQITERLESTSKEYAASTQRAEKLFHDLEAARGEAVANKARAEEAESRLLMARGQLALGPGFGGPFDENKRESAKSEGRHRRAQPVVDISLPPVNAAPPSPPRLLRDMVGDRGKVQCLAFSPDSGLLASGTSNTTIEIWEPRTGRLVQTLKGHKRWLTAIVFLLDGNSLISASEDKQVIVWDVATGRIKLPITGHPSQVWALAVSPDGGTLATASDVVRFYDPTTGRLRTVLSKEHSGMVSALAFSRNGRLMASGGDDKKVILWDLAKNQPCHVMTGHHDQVWSVAFTPDSQMLVSGSSDRRVIIWNVQTGKASHVLEGHADRVQCVATSFDGRTIASGSDDKNIILWDTQTGTRRAVLTGHARPVRAVAFSPDETMLATGSWDLAVKVWDLTGQADGQQ